MEGNSRARTGIVCLQSFDHILMSKKNKKKDWGEQKRMFWKQRGEHLPYQIRVNILQLVQL